MEGDQASFRAVGKEWENELSSRKANKASENLSKDENSMNNTISLVFFIESSGSSRGS